MPPPGQDILRGTLDLVILKALSWGRRTAMPLSAAGVVVGLAAALALGRFIQGQLFGVALLDP